MICNMHNKIISILNSKKMRSEITKTSLILAIILHVNQYFSFIYGIVVLRLIAEKLFLYSFQSNLNQFFLLPLYCKSLAQHFPYATSLFLTYVSPLIGIFCLVEVPRLFTGQYGNTHKDVPKLAMCLVLSIFPQLPVVIYLCKC